ncbi:MAG TPA: protease modulator HflK [Verrucomicrobiae bacterium]
MNDDHPHSHDHGPAPETQDAGSQALAEALRSSFAIVKVVMLLMVVAFFASGFFTVGSQEKAVILRFGKPVGVGESRLLGAGWHWSLPYPIDEVVKIPITQQQIVQSTIGWYFTTPEQVLSGEELFAGPSLNPAIDGYVITGDQNIVHSLATLRYHVRDPFNYTFNFASASNLVQNALNNALLYTAAHFNVDDILTRDVDGFREAVGRRVENLAEQEQLGIVVDQCNVDSVPPRQLKAIFDQVEITRNKRNEDIVNANSYTNQVLSLADAQAATIIQQATLARANYVTNVLAEAQVFDGLLPVYQFNPRLFTQKYTVEMMAEVLTNAEHWVEPTSGSGIPTEVRLQLSRRLPEQKTTASP